MDITNPALPYLFALAAIGVLVMLVIGWPSTLPRPLTLTVRTGQAIVMNLLVIACAGLMLNNQYLFYVSWSDLVGPNSTAAQTIARGSAKGGANVQLQQAVTVSSGVLPPLPSPGQQEQRYTVTGAQSGVTGQVIVMLPQGYSQNPTRPYPVLEMMSGYPGVPQSSLRAFDLTGQWQSLIAAHTMADPVIVIPQINTPDNIIDTECINDPTGHLPQTETWLASDIPNWVGQHFRVSAQRSSWATIGYSYGGWCASMLTMRHPQTFGGAVNIMGYFAPEFGDNFDPMTGNKALADQYNLGLLARTHPPAVSMMLMASKHDPVSYPYIVKFLPNVKSPTSVTSLILKSGGHNINIIPPRLPAIMKWLARSLSGFAYQP